MQTTNAIRDKLQNVSGGSHAGLILSRYLKKQEDGDKTDRKELFDRAKAAPEKVQHFYKIVFERWKKVWEFVPGKENYRGSMRNFDVENRMIIGLGSDNVLEAGLTLHHTYGVPYIPGSAVKGLCAHYCHELGEELGDDYRENGKVYRVIFGTTQEAGMIRFYDALIDPASLKNCLQLDVMTPHHMEYYGSKDDTPPTEYDAPNPVTFLSVTGKFLFVISCDDTDENGFVKRDGQKLITFVWQLLRGALENKGIGGKTNSGYGYGTLRNLDLPVKEPLKPGTLVILTRLSKKEAKEAEANEKKLLFKDDEENLCIVPLKQEEAIKNLAPQPGNTVTLAFDSEQTQGERKFLMFRLPEK